MDGVASGFAVVSMAIQIAGTVQKIRDFLRSVQNAPNELTKLVETLEQLHGTLNQVRHLLEQQYSILRLPGSPVFMESALQNRSRKVSTLEKVVDQAKNTLARQSRVKRTWAAMKLVSEKEDTREMQSQLLHAETGLQTAMLSNLWQLQMHPITVANSSTLQAEASDEASLSLPATSGSQRVNESNTSSCISKKHSSRSTKEINSVWYHGLLGVVDVQHKSKSLEISDFRWDKNKAVANENLIRIKPSFMRKVLELRLANSFGRISRTLSMYHVVLERDTPLFNLCVRGDLRGLHIALGKGDVSPFVVDECGETLLHYAARHHHTELCDHLLQIGVDPDHRDDNSHKAIAKVGAWSHDPEEPCVETLRLLLRHQDEMSSRDLRHFWGTYMGTVEGAEFIFGQDSIQFENSDNEVSYPPLAQALWSLGCSRPGWDNFLRQLIRRGARLHAPVRLDLDRFYGYPCPAAEYGSPLDELFLATETPFEGGPLARHWLQILTSEGCDVQAYLEEEYALRAAQMQLTYPWRRNIPRQLIFFWGSSPYVSWDWWIDPDSPISLVCEDFKHMALSSPDYRGLWDEGEGKWKEFWPFTYRASHLYHLSGWHPPYERAQERFNRRAKKRLNKLARAQGFRARSKMPGAWPV